LAKQLTQAAITKLKPTSKRRRVRDGGAKSLYLLIQPTGSKSWAMFFRDPGGGPIKVTLGPLDASGRKAEGNPEISKPLTLTAARKLAAQINHDRALGVDFKKKRPEASQAFGQACRDYVVERAMPRTRRWRDAAKALGIDPTNFSQVDGGLARRWSNKSIDGITASDVRDLIEEARRKGIPGQAAR
jgi:hypothetical protein